MDKVNQCHYTTQMRIAYCTRSRYDKNNSTVSKLLPGFHYDCIVPSLHIPAPSLTCKLLEVLNVCPTFSFSVHSRSSFQSCYYQFIKVFKLKMKMGPMKNNRKQKKKIILQSKSKRILLTKKKKFHLTLLTGLFTSIV